MNDSALPLLWTGLGLVAPLGARVSGPLPAGVGGVSIDTRTLQGGDLFFAITGEKANGHDHVGAAFAAGARAAVVDEAHADGLQGAGPLFVVHDVLVALEGLGRAARARTRARIAAVTGSVGKTSTKDALALVLAQAGMIHASKASYNNHWGVPLTLARMPRQTQFGVYEIGMSHAGEITPLVEMVRPHVAIVTTIAPVHLENFGSVRDIARAKGEIFSGLVKGGVAIINRDVDDYPLLADLARASQASHVISFGNHAEADARLDEIEIFPEGTYVHAHVLGKAMRYRLGAPGRHFAENSLAVLLAARALGLDVETAAQTLDAFHPPSGRGLRCTLMLNDGTMTLVDESYNANPASMRAALAVLGALPVSGGGRRIAVLGDMLELGAHENALHGGLAETIADENIDLVFAVGTRMRNLFERLPSAKQAGWYENATDVLQDLAPLLVPGDVVMVKGSNGSRMGDVVRALVERFAETAIARPLFATGR